MKIVLVGCGGISRAWLEAVQTLPGLELVGLVDLDEAAARQRAEQFGLDVPVGVNLEAMLRQTQPEVVFNCTVPQAHFDVTLTALGAGCHVFGEKPMTDSLHEARDLIRVSKAAGRVFAVMQNRRYDPNIRRLRAFLASGVLGKITTASADFYIGARFGGFRDHMRHVLVKDMAIHTFDAARFLLAQDPEAVYCHEWNPSGSWYDRDASAVAIFEMDNGAVFSYRGSWCAEGLRTTWESAWRIIGTKGSVSWDGAAGFKAEGVVDDSGFLSSYTPLELPPEPLAMSHTGHVGAIEAFVEAVQNAREPETVCSDNVKSLAMVLGANESAESRTRVELALEM